MLKHCVFVDFRDDVSEQERLAVLAGFGTLMGQVEGMLDYCYGENLDFEGKSENFGEGFIVTFANRTAHLAYEAHERHIALGKRLVEMCQGGHQGIVVFDIECSQV